MRRLTLFIFKSYFVGAIVALAALVASAYLVAPTGAASVVRLPIHAAMLDIIRCSPPTHPDAWRQKTTMGAHLELHDLRLGSLLHRTDVYDPSDCGRVITQAMNPSIAPKNPARPG
jgi:hypothetical protein